jgi:hypothetical protein
MSKSRIALSLCICVLALSAFARQAYAQAGVTSLQINVPVKNTLPQRPITTLRVAVTLDSEPSMGSPVGFTVTDGNGVARVTGNLFPGAAIVNEDWPIPAANGAPAPVLGDHLRVTSPSAALPAGDQARKTYSFVISLLSNYNPSDVATPCSTTMGLAETWTIAVTTGTSRILGACLRSFDQQVVGSECTGLLRLIPVGVVADPPATIITAGLGGATQTCGESRGAVDLIMVLDKSGSMGSPAAGGVGPTKMDKLHDAVTNFINTWQAMRTAEGVGAPVGDSVGLVFFDTDAHWMNDVGVAAWAGVSPGLTTLDVAHAGLITANINSVGAGGSTSIGDGLIEGSAKLFDAAHAANGHRKVLVVMSNGMENTTQRVDVDVPGMPTTIRTFPSGSMVKTPLPNLANMSVYTVTVGSGMVVSAAINEDMARAGHGFYLNSETDAALLSPYFQMILQNAVKFNTYETVRMVHDTATPTTAYTTSFPLTSTSQTLAVSVGWEASRGPLRLTLTPPGGGAPIVRTGSGSIILAQGLPLPPPYTLGSPWQLKLETLTTPGAQAQPAPFDLVILADDLGINSDLTSVNADYVPGNKIRLQAKLTAFGSPILNVGGSPGDSMLVRLLKPGETVGDLLSTSTASSTGPAPEPMSPAEIKLKNELAAHPNALAQDPDNATLFDDGNASHGDAVPGDGIYSALYPVEKPGHYNFLFAVEGGSRETGRFSRQQLKTVYVRSVPDSDQTNVTSSIQNEPRALIVNMNPRTKFGNRMGPGWANYFWFTGGATPVKPVDNLNGTYTAKIPFSGATPPAVEIHFIHVSSPIDDSATPADLPAPLDGSNVIKTVPPPGGGGGGGFKRWGVSLHAGASFPHGDFNSVFNPGPNFGLDLEYRITPTISLEGIYGFHHFSGETFGGFTVPDVNVHQFSFNGKIYGSSAPVRPFFNFGGGAYKFDPSDTRGGVNVGGGVQFDVTPTFAVDAMYNFHNVFTSGSNTSFSGVQGGVRFRF